MTIYDIEHQINELQESVQQTNGSLSTLEEQYVKSQDKLDDLIIEKDLNSKAIQVLTLVQDSTTTIITNMFQDVVTQALQYIHQDDRYDFELEFGRRGNLPELSFNVRTPDMQEPHDILSTRGGGTCDVISLALRMVMLEISKTDGFLFLDEPFKMLDNDETIQKGMEFIKEIQKNTKRQIQMITHQTIITDNEEGVKWIK